MAWEENSNKLAACEETNHIRVYDTSGWNSPLSSPGTPITYNVGHAIRTCVFIPGTTDVMVGTSNYKTHKIPDPYTSKVLSNSFSDKVNDLDFRKGSSNYVVGLEDYNWYYSTDFGSSTNLGGKVYSVEYSPTNEFYSVAGEGGILKIYNSLNEENTLNDTFQDTGGTPYFDASFSADGEYLIVGSEDPYLFIYSLNGIASNGTCASPDPTPDPSPDNSTNSCCIVGEYYDEDQDKCIFCNDLISGCGYCNNSLTCMACVLGFYLNAAED